MVEARVRAIVSAVQQGAEAKHFGNELREFGARGARALLELLSTEPTHGISGVLSCLEYCWDQSATEPVRAMLAAHEEDVRKAAAELLDRTVGRRTLARFCDALTSHEDMAVADFAALHAEPAFPDDKRMLSFARRGAPTLNLYRYLARYYAPALRDACVSLLEHDDPWIRRAAIGALAEQNDDRPATRALVSSFLSATWPWLRGAAAEYFLRHATEDDASILRDALEHESDDIVRGALTCALNRLPEVATWDREHDDAESRKAADCSSTPEYTAPMDVRATAERYRAIAEAAEATPTRARAPLRQAFSRVEPFEPVWMMDDQGHADAGFVAARNTRYDALRAVFDLPEPGSAYAASALQPDAPPPCAGLIQPVFDFPEWSQPSFGHHLGAHSRLFSSQVHVGEDVAWHQGQATLVSIGAGVVRDCGLVPSWGHLIIIEHRATPGLTKRLMNGLGPYVRAFDETIVEDTIDDEGCLRFCSVYAHLGADFTVCSGMTVERGQRIASVGRSYSWENGGYGAHLHLGLHLGPRVQRPCPGAIIDSNFEGKPYRARVTHTDDTTTYITIRKSGREMPLQLATEWLRGYISSHAWRARDHGWMPPASVISASQQ